MSGPEPTTDAQQVDPADPADPAEGAERAERADSAGTADPVDAGDAVEQRAAAAVRRLGALLAGTRLTVDDLTRLADTVESLATDLAGRPDRDKAVDMQQQGRWAHIRRTGQLPPPPAEGGTIEFDRRSIVGGPLSPFGLVAHHRREGDEAVCRVTATAPFEGPAHRVHGGVVALIVDEAMATVLPMHGVIAFTGELRIRLVAAAPLGSELVFRSRLRERNGRRLIVTCEGDGVDGRFVEAEATFVEIDPTRLPWFTAAPSGEATTTRPDGG